MASSNACSQASFEKSGSDVSLLTPLAANHLTDQAKLLTQRTTSVQPVPGGAVFWTCSRRNTGPDVGLMTVISGANPHAANPETHLHDSQ